MRASVPERVEQGGNDALRDPLRSKGRPLVVDVDEVMVPGSSFPADIASEITSRLRAVTTAIATALGLQRVLPMHQASIHPARGSTTTL